VENGAAEEVVPSCLSNSITVTVSVTN